MAKENKRGNRETKKPKQVKPTPLAVSGDRRGTVLLVASEGRKVSPPKGGK